MKNTKETNKEMYKALKVAQTVIKELLYDNPKGYQYQQDLIQNTIDTVDAQ